MALIVFDKFYDSAVGGAQKSLHSLVNRIPGPKQIVSCDVKSAFFAERHRIAIDGITRLSITEVPKFPYFEYWLNRNAIRQHFSKFSASDILITQEIWGAMAASTFPGRTVFFVRNELSANSAPNYYRGIPRLLKRLYLLLNKPFLELFFRDNRAAQQRATLVIANSKFIADLVKRNIGVTPEILYPSIDLASLGRANPESLPSRPYIVLVGNSPLKGAAIFRKIATRLPRLKFLIFARGCEAERTEGNLTYRPWTTKASEVYSEARIVLIPSIWGEGFGRVALEAGVLGIPCIGSNSGGLPEALCSEMLIQDTWDIDAWTRKILAVNSELARYSAIAVAQAHRFLDSNPEDRFLKLLHTHLGMPIETRNVNNRRHT